MLFAGSWCKDDSREAIWSKLDHETVPYHWDDVEVLDQGRTYSLQVYESLLGELAAALNAHHHLDWPLRSWRIVVGPWLRRYITIVYDRYRTIQIAIEDFDVSGASCASPTAGSLVSADFTGFTDLYDTDAWNYHLFSLIVPRLTDIQLLTREIGEEPAAVLGFGAGGSLPDPSDQSKITNLAGIRRFLTGSLKKAYRSKHASSFLRWLARNNKFYVYLPYLPSAKDELKLALKLGDVPLINATPTKPPPARYDPLQRERFGLRGTTGDPFQRLARDLLPEMLPICHLEAFSDFVTLAESGPFPENPKVVFTAAGLYHNEVVKVWFAEKITKGVRLIVGQHGGHYQTFRVTTESETHELAVSDRYFSWGWTLPDQCVKALPSLKLINMCDGEWDEQGHVVIVTRPLFKYCRTLSTGSLPGKNNREYLAWLEALIEGLSSDDVHDMIVALHPGERGAREKGVFIGSRLRAKFPNVALRSPTTPLEQIYAHSKLNVFTYDGTPFLESIGLDRPSVLIVNPETEPLADIALPFYQRLQDVGIYHPSVDSALSHIARISDSVATWWNSPSVVEAKNFYRETFARRSANGLRELADELKKANT